MVLARSGLPYTVTLGAVTQSGTGWTTNQRPNVVSGVDHVGVINGPTRLAQPGRVLDATRLERSARWGATRSADRVSFRWTRSLFKNVQLAGNQKVQLRVEVFNLINRLQLPSAPNANFLAPATFGQFFNTFGRTEGFGTSRQIQFAARYTF